MRIVIPTGIFPPDIGGPASYVPRIASALQARGHSVQVITLADNPSGGGVHPIPVWRIRRGRNRLLRMGETIHKIRRSARRADLIYANGLFIEAAIAAALARKPLVMKIVGDWAWERARNQGAGNPMLEDFQSRRQSLWWETVKYLRSAISRQAKIVITPSRYLECLVVGWGVPKKRIRVIYNAMDPLPVGLPPSWPLFHGVTLLMIGRLVRWKGIATLLRMLAIRRDCRLFIIGDGPERRHLETLAQDLQVEDRVVFLGGLPRERVAGCLRAADAFVLPSLYEGLPHVLLEAFDAGIPVIATAVGGTTEIVVHGENGLLIPPDDPIALSMALDRLLADPGFGKALAGSARRSLQSKFRWDPLVEQTERVLMEAAGLGVV